MGGRDLDMLVAERVFGWLWDESRCPVCGWPYDKGCKPGDCSMRPRPERIASEVLPYSFTWEGAGMLLDHLDRRGIWWAVSRLEGDREGYRCYLESVFSQYPVAQTAPLAIARAMALHECKECVP